MKSVQIKTVGVSILALGATMTSVSAAKKTAKAPNVIYILADDLGYADLSCYGQTNFSTPNIDAMAAGGIQFMQHYAGCTVSAPSRCALMTGKHTGHTYVRGNKGTKASDGKTYDTALPASEVTIAELFKEQDYATACIGKWGLGAPQSSGHPNNQGFDYFYGYLGQAHAHKYFPEFLHENETLVELDGTQYSHDLIEGKAIDFITENQDKPFFIYLTFTLPHAELVMPEKDMERFVGKFPEKRFKRVNNGTYGDQAHPHAAFAGMVERMDLSVGRINALLRDLGLRDNTLVFFSSDNGAHMEGGADPKFFNSTGIYRGIKRDLYEGGIRVPFIAYMPSHVPAGVQNNDMSAFWDMMPTLAELIDVECPESSDGISILPTLMGKKQKQKHDALYWEFHEKGGRRAIREGDWKLIELNVNTPEQRELELYNITEDPSETKNLAESNPELVKAMYAKMGEQRVESSIFQLNTK